MKLLITTQTVDKNDPILGFFHGWVTEFAQHFERIDVICLRMGEHNLPDNVFVHSLGKETGENRFKYLWRFWEIIFHLNHQYDVVFSHMNPHYIVLAGWYWLLKRKRIFFWRNHAQMNVMTKISAFFAHKVFYTSPFACTRVFKHSVQMPVGIDTNLSKPDPATARKTKSVLFLGRISPVKRPEIFVEAAQLLADHDFHVYGVSSQQSASYQDEIKTLSQGSVTFHSAIPNFETPKIYSEFDVYVNLTPEGSMDKTVLEAAACGALVLVANKSFEQFVQPKSMVSNVSPQAVAHSIQELSDMPEAEKAQYRNELIKMVQKKHSLQHLTAELVREITS